MRMMLLAAMLAASPALAQVAAQPVCIRAEIVPGFEAWGKGGSGGVLKIGPMATLELEPATTIKFTPLPARAPAAGTTGGQFAFTVEKAGTYRIALGGKAWMEVIEDGQRLTSVAHEEGKPCTGIRKIVDFSLKPGPHLLQLSEASTASMAAMVVAKP